MEPRSLAVVGVGAIGGAVAADLADLGPSKIEIRATTDPSFVDAAIRTANSTTGIVRTDAEKEAELRDAPRVDWVLLATKAHQSDAAAPWLERLCRSSRTRVAVLQNGVDHVERIQPLVPPATVVLPVVVQIPAEKTAPGTIEQSRAGMLIVPNTRDGIEFAALFEGARTRVDAHPDFRSQSWWKLISNASIGGVCALAQKPNGAVRDPETRALVLALMREVIEVGRAEGANLPDDAPEKVLHAILTAAPDHWSSISVDRREGRPMEWQARNAVVGRLGRKHGIATPLNDVITTMLRLADGDWTGEHQVAQDGKTRDS
jgi:2-dehydropantoate 2-reductase